MVSFASVYNILKRNAYTILGSITVVLYHLYVCFTKFRWSTRVVFSTRKAFNF